MINLTRRQVFWLGVAVGTIAVIFLVLVLLSWLQPAPSVQTALGKLNSTQADHATRIAGLDTISKELLSTLTADASNPTEPPRESCELVATERTNTHLFPGGGGCSSLDAGDRVQVAVRTADGFWGYDPDQAGNANLFRYLWVLKSSTVRLEGDCAAVPVVGAPIVGKYAISNGDTPVYQTADKGLPTLLTLQKGDYAMIVGATQEQWMVTLYVSSRMTEGIGIGWVDQATTDVEFVVDGCG